MRTTILLLAGLSLIGAASARGQRRIRVGPTYSSLSLEDLSGASHSFSSFGGSAALITGDDAETVLTIALYTDLSTDGRLRRLMQFAMIYYSLTVSARGDAAPI